MNDTLTRDMFAYDVPEGPEDHAAVAALDEVYATPLGTGTGRLVADYATRRPVADYATAELAKAAANSFRSIKISFINAMPEVREAAGADITGLADAIGLDDRVGRKFLNAGIGFGGDCLPKDIRAFMARSGELSADQALTFLGEVDDINMRRRTRIVEMTRELCGGVLMGQRITVLGAAFKPNSDDVPDSPALSIAAQLQLQGAVVTVTDPESLGNAAWRFPELNYETDAEEALRNANAVLLLTEWQAYRGVDPHEARNLVRNARVLDGRIVLDPQKWRVAGWIYRGVGRP